MTHTAGLGYTIVTKGPLQKAYEQAGIIPFAANRGTEPQMRAVRPKHRSRRSPTSVATLPLIADPGNQVELFDRARRARARDRNRLGNAVRQPSCSSVS